MPHTQISAKVNLNALNLEIISLKKYKKGKSIDVPEKMATVITKYTPSWDAC